MQDVNRALPDEDSRSAETARLCLLARQAIAAEHLPGRPASRMWGSAGHGEICSLCGVVITPQQLAFELEFKDSAASETTHFLHGPCCAAWEAESQRRAARPANGHDENKAENGQLNGNERDPAP